MYRFTYTAPVVLAVCLAAGCKPAEDHVPSSPPQATAPQTVIDFAVPSLTAGTGEIRASDLRGQVVLVDFWATWCLPCIREIPELNALHQDLSSRDFTLVGMSVDAGEQQDLAKKVAGFSLSYPVGWAGAEVQQKFGGIRAVPTKFLLDRNGAIRGRYVGVVPVSGLRTDIEALLSE